MAHETQTHSSPSALSLEVSAMVNHTVLRVTDYVAYRKTVRELSKLDAASLADLGIHRSGIRAAARQAVYGR